MKTLIARKFNAQFLDWVGGCLSTACAIHCSVKPLLLILPSLAWIDFLVAHSTERFLLFSGILLAISSTLWGFSKHGEVKVFAPLTAAVITLLIGHFQFTGLTESLLVVPGGLTIASIHLVNMKLRENYHSEDNCRDRIP